MAQSNITVRIMAANLTGNSQTYGDSQIRILQSLKPDVVCMQEFRYGGDSPAEIRSLVDTAFGTNFVYYRETDPSYDIPNGVVSRYPIVSSGSWDDTNSPNRGFAWAQIHLPGTNDLYAISVHLLTSDSATRGQEAAQLKSLIQAANWPANAWIVIAGDMNTDSRGESAISTFKTFLSDSPIPTDEVSGGDPDTNLNRNKPYDYVLPSFTLAALQTNVVIGSYSFPNGLVFDSRVYTNLPDVAPVLLNDSANGQHMAVIKDFVIPVTGTNTSGAPFITTQPQSQSASPGSNATFTVSATGSAPLSYQWLFNGTNITSANANTYTVTNVQFTNAGVYSVVVTNLSGTAISSNAVLTVSNFPPSIVTQPQSQTVSVGQAATFNVTASGTAPLSYQWRFGGTNIPGANTNSHTVSNVQSTNLGDYSVVITNIAGSVTSSVATLTALTTNSVILAQWNFNSVTPDGSTSTGSLLPSAGSGTASLVGGATATFAGGDTSLDPAGTTDNSGWNTSTYPAQSTGDRTRGVQFNVSTAGRQNIAVSFSSQASNTGSKYIRLLYTTNGTDFLPFPTGATNTTSFTAKTNNLASISDANNNTNFAIRIVAEFESDAVSGGANSYVAANSGSSYGTGGTIRFDMVTITGAPIATNSAPAAPIMTALNLSGGQFQFGVTGTAGATYIVQSSTNLSANGWVSVATNVAPFTFTESNISTGVQEYYRVISKP